MRKNVNKILSIALAASLMMSTLMTPSVAAYAKDATDIDSEITETVETTEEITEEITDETTEEVTEDTTEEVSEETTEELTEETTEEVTEETEEEEEEIEEEYDNPDTVTASDTKYDPSDKLTAPKERVSTTNVSWPFAICAAAEANIQKKEGYDTAPDLSEYQLMYFNGIGKVADPLKLTSDYYFINDGSSLYKTKPVHPTKASSYPNLSLDFALRRMAGWIGLVNETDAEFKTTQYDLADDLCFAKDAYYLNSYETIACTNKTAIKQAIVDYGAVATSIYLQDPSTGLDYWSKKPGNSSTRVSYNCTTATQPDTEITLVGWDDTYTDSTVTTPGAWLCKYSRGTTFSGGGYIWIAYNDKSLTKSNNKAYAMDFVKNNRYDNNYHYDGGPYDFITSTASWEGVVYKVAGYDTQKLTAVGLTTVDSAVSCEISIYTGTTSEVSYPNSGTLKTTKSVTISNPGYHVITLDEPVLLNPETKYTVMVHYNTPTRLVLDASATGDNAIAHYQIATGGAYNRSFWSSTSSEPAKTSDGWNDCYSQSYESRIKAFTVGANVGSVVKVNEITLNKTETTILKGEKEKLEATVLPEDAAVKTLEWNSDNPSVASVDALGNVSANSAGTAHITCKSKDGSNITASCTVTVTTVKKVKTITLDTTSATLDALTDNRISLTATITPADADDNTVTWVSDDPSIAYLGDEYFVSSNGKSYIDVYAAGAGTTTIRCTANDGSEVEAICTITVTSSAVKATSVTVSPKTLTLTVGDTDQLTATVAPSNATNKSVTWTSSDESIVTVNTKGELEAVAEGTATVTVTTIDGSNKSDTCTVTVKPEVIKVQTIKLSTNILKSMYYGNTYGLSGTLTVNQITPSNATDKSVTWTSSNTKIVKVEAIDDVKCRLTATGVGTANITCTANDGSGVSSTCAVTVNQAATSITIEPATLSMMEGETQKLTATVLPSNAYQKNVKWSSSNPEVVKVDSNGNVTALTEGAATISATTDNMGAVGTCEITIGTAVESISLNKSELTLKTGETETLIPSILPDDAMNKTVKWTTDDSTVATVDSTGKITAVGAGTTTITCTANGGFDKKASCIVTVIQLVTDISISPEAKQLIVGDTSPFTATVTPSTASNKAVTWTSSDTGVATVDVTGKVTAVGAGSATIKATAKDGTGVYGTAEVEVKLPIVKATKLSISTSSQVLSLVVGNSKQLETTIEPANTTDKTLKWSSNDTTKATVSQDGLVMAVGAGTVTITAETTDGSGLKATQRFSISRPTIEASAVTLNKNSMELETGSNETLIATVYPDSATNKNVTWSSSDTKVATVVSGKVTAVGEGIATITCTASSGAGIKTTCIVTVKDPIIAVSEVRLDQSTAAIETGDTLALVATVLPNNANNKEVIWTSSDNTKAVVSANGVVTAKSAGTVTITCTSADDATKKASCTITITDPVVLVTSIAVNPSELTLDVDAIATITATALPEDADDRSYTWSSSNENIVTVSKTGIVSAKSAGTAKIYATANDGSNVKGECTVTVKAKVISDVKVSSIIVDPTSKTIDINTTFTLSYTVNPSNATNSQVAITSSDESIATVTAAGVVAGKKAGKAYITVAALDGSGKSATCEVTVVKPVVNVSSVTFTETSKTVTEGETYAIAATVLPTDADNKALIWSSDNEGVAIVSSTGVVTALAAGTANIKATSKDGSNKSATCKITVNAKVIPVTEITLDKADSTMAIGGTVTLAATVKPENATNKSVTWTSSNTAVATVSAAGVVTAVKAGEAVITCEAADGSGKKAACHITVESSDIKVSSITVNPTTKTMTVGESDRITITVLPENATNKAYTVRSSDNNVVTVSNDGTMVATGAGTANITIIASDGSGKTATCSVTVNAKNITVTEVLLDRNIADLLIGETITLNAYIMPSDATNKDVVWSSDDESIATVSQTGEVIAKAAGEVLIKCASRSNPSISASCVVFVTKPKVLVKSIAVAPSTLTLNENGTATITATALPEDADDKSYTWTSANPVVATVSSTGVVTAKSVGITKLYAIANDGSNVKGECTITVKEKPSPSEFLVSRVSVSPISKSLKIKETFTLTYEVVPDYATNTRVSITSSDDTVATVTSEGVVTAKKAGTAFITVAALDGSGKSASCEVTVEEDPAAVLVSSITLDKTTASVEEGSAVQLTATIAPSDATDKSVEWSSSEAGIATVSTTGMVTAVKPGTATITVAATDGSGVKATCVVTVTAKKSDPGKIDISTATVTTPEKQYAYTKAAVVPEPKVVVNGSTLVKGADYIVSYTSNVNPGKATVVITGTGKYKGTASGYFYIMPEKVTLSSVENTSSAIKLKWKKAVGANGYDIYRSDNGKAYKKIKSITSGSTVTYSDKASLTVGKKYQYKIVAVNSADNVGAYSAVKTIYRLKNVAISSLNNSAAGTVTLKWKKATSVTGYEIRYSTDKNFKSKKTATVTKASTISKKLTKLKKGKKYYVSIRSYKKVGGKKYYSAWSTAKTVTIKK